MFLLLLVCSFVHLFDITLGEDRNVQLNVQQTDRGEGKERIQITDFLRKSLKKNWKNN